MNVCPGCLEPYFGTPEKCPNCQQTLPKPIFAYNPISVPKGYSAASESTQHEGNIGNTVQKIAIAILVQEAIASLVCAIVFAANVGYFLLILFVGLITSALSFVLIYAYGRLVESSIITAENSEESLKHLRILTQDIGTPRPRAKQ